MTNNEPAQPIGATAIDYEQLYRGAEVLPGVRVARPPWDIGRPQPLLSAIERAGGIEGEVLDIGCGPGDTAIHLAGLGYRVTGVDVSPTAIEQARLRAAEHGVSVTFDVGDAATLTGYDGRFDTVVSSALLHCLDPRQRRAHVRALARAIKPGGRVVQFSFSPAEHAELYAPYPISESELRGLFGPPVWVIGTLVPGRLEVMMPTAEIAGRFGRSGFRPERTEAGDLSLPVLVLEARRA